jgi:hypothetical protein
MCLPKPALTEAFVVFNFCTCKTYLSYKCLKISRVIYRFVSPRIHENSIESSQIDKTEFIMMANSLTHKLHSNFQIIGIC